MTRWFVLPLVGCLGCDAPVCKELEPYAGTQGAAAVSPLGDLRRGSARLVEGGQETSASFVAKLSGLPELSQPNGAVQDGLARLEVKLRYEQAPFGDDGKTQMPRFSLGLALDQEPDAQHATTPMFPHGSPTVTSRQLFPVCTERWMTHCCPRGARECEQSIRLRIERLDGTAFPPVAVDWLLNVSARASDCPSDGDPVLELSEAEQ